jgi:3-oxoadipate enol-lactonase
MGYLQTISILTEYVIERHGYLLHYWRAGASDRPLIVMMHGAAMDHRMFNMQVDALSAEYSVLVWDARGHGKSQPNTAQISLSLYAQDMLSVLDHIGAEKCVAVGQSLGGYIAQHLYMQAPDRLQAMIVIGSTPIWKAYGRFEIWALKASLPMFELWPYNNFTKVIANNTAIKKEVRQYALDAARSIPKQQFVQIWKAVTLAVNNEGMDSFRISIPLLLMHGDQDRTGTIKRDMPYWAKRETHAEYHVIPDAGHNANQDNAEAVNRLMYNFLQRHVP